MNLGGAQLKELIKDGLQRHEKYLTLTSERVLLDFHDSLQESVTYDLFSCFAELILTSDVGAGLLIADMMKVIDGHSEMIPEDLLSTLGYFFSDYLKKPDSLEHFRGQ